MLEITHRSYPGKTRRPSPYIKEDALILSIITPWNAEISQAEKVVNLFSNYYSISSEDLNKTRMTKPKPYLSSNEDLIYSALEQTNEKIFYEHNEKELSLGFEACFIVETLNEITLAGIGQPHIYISKDNQPLHPVGLSSSSDSLNPSPHLDPLPYHLLGAHDETSIFIQSIKKMDKNQLVLTYRNYIPGSFIDEQNRSLDVLSNILAQENQDIPFWLGLVHTS